MTVSPSFTDIFARLPSSRIRPGPTAITFPCCGFSLAVSGSTIPPAVRSSCVCAFTTTLSPSGRIFIVPNLLRKNLDDGYCQIVGGDGGSACGAGNGPAGGGSPAVQRPAPRPGLALGCCEC